MKNNLKQHKWKELSFKDKLSFIFAEACFVLGWLITFIAFFIEPVGTVADAILWILGQSLLFSGAVIGIGQYYNSETQNFKYEITKMIKNKIKDSDTDKDNNEVE